MTEALIFNKMYYHPIIGELIYYHFKDDKMSIRYSKDNWNDMLSKTNILNNIQRLIDFFDTVDIRISILPHVEYSSWSYRLYSNNQIIIDNDFDSRKQATLGAINKAIEIFDENQSYEKTINDE